MTIIDNQICYNSAKTILQQARENVHTWSRLNTTDKPDKAYLLS